jgi:hypothetical protein
VLEFEIVGCERVSCGCSIYKLGGIHLLVDFYEPNFSLKNF